MDGSQKPTRPERALYGWVYLAWLGDLLKIGCTLYPERRRQQHEKNTGRKLREWKAFWVYAPGVCERFLHKKLACARTEGEWFAIDNAEHFSVLCKYLDKCQVAWPQPEGADDG